MMAESNDKWVRVGGNGQMGKFVSGQWFVCVVVVLQLSLQGMSFTVVTGGVLELLCGGFGVVEDVL